MDEGEFEVALYSLAGIARAVEAGPSVWRFLQDAADAMQLDVKQRRRAYLS